MEIREKKALFEALSSLKRIKSEKPEVLTAEDEKAIELAERVVDGWWVISVGGIDPKDYPDFCDAYVEEATLRIGEEEIELSDEEIEDWCDRNDDRVNEQACLQFVVG